MMYDEILMNIDAEEACDTETSLNAFIPNFMENGKYELVEKLGFDFRKFKASGGILYISSLGIDFNYPIKYTKELIVRLSLVDVTDKHMHVVSMVYNKLDNLVAKAITTFINFQASGHRRLNLHEYFKKDEYAINNALTY